MGKKRRVNNMAWDYPLFRKRYQWEYNPGVEPTQLLTEDNKTFLTYVHQDGTEKNYTVYQFFNEKLWTILPAVSDGILMAMDYPEFRDTFQPENNPGVDPYTLRKWDDDTHLVHINEYGIKINYTSTTFFNKRLWETMPYRKIVYEMAMDYKEFRDTFQQKNNPGVDPHTLRKWDYDTHLVHINEYGVKTNYTPGGFFNKRLWEIMLQKENKCEMAMDYKEFRDTFQQENNPGVDPYTLRKWNDYTPLVHINEYGIKTKYTPTRFFYDRLWEIMLQKENKCEMAMDYEEFRDTFQQENNPGVDPYTLRKWDKYTHLTHINEYGITTKYTPNRFFSEKLWEIMLNRKSVYVCKMAMDYKEFRDTFQQENNPGVNPYTLRKWDRNTYLIHINEYGITTKYTPNRFFRERLWETMPYIKTNRTQHKKAKRSHVKHEMAMDYPEFASFFQKENNPGIDPYTLRKWCKDIRLIHINQYGVKTYYTPDYFFRKRIWEYVPYRQYELGATVNALELDKDIALYIKNEKELEKLTNTGVHTNKAFQCPFCGGEFSKKLAEMINNSPKCPFCSDTGLYEAAADEDICGAFLKHN